MVPLVVFVAASAAFGLAGALGVRSLATWRAAVRAGLVVLFVFTGATHFTPMRHAYAAMIPPPFTGALWLVALTGVLELAGAVGLLVPRLRRAAGVGLILLLLALLPANVYAAVAGVPFLGRPATALGLRIAVQVVFVGALWGAVVAPSAARASRPVRPDPRLA